MDWDIISIQDLRENSSGIRNWTTESCVEGWEYNRTQVQSSIVIDVSIR